MGLGSQWLFLMLMFGLVSAFPYQAGWPQYPAGGVDFSSPALVDVNGDDTLEVLVAGQAHQVHLWNHRGEPLPGWPKPVESASLDETSSPAVGDIDHDGSCEIVYASASGGLYAWELDGSSVAGFPVGLGDNVIRSSVTLEDLDQDDSLEILIGTGNSLNRFFAFRHDGRLLWSKDTDGRVHSTPAVADLERDRDLEVVVGNDGVYPQAGAYAWHHDGTLVSGWPKVCGHHVDPSPALADIDSDGDYEVFFGSLDNHLYGLDHRAHDLPGWPNRCGSGLYEGIVSSPAVADLDGNSILEVVTGRGIIQSNSGAVYAFTAAGETLSGFPVLTSSGSVLSSPCLADIDEDGDLEIIVGCQGGKLHGLHHNGSVALGFPIEVGAPVTSSPAAGDIDLDGDVEIAVGGKYDSLYIWDLPARYDPDWAPWPMFHHDPLHTGRLPLGPVSVSRTEPPQPADVLRLALTRDWLLISGPPRRHLELGLFDQAGRKHLQWSFFTDAHGEAAIRVGRLPSGVYFAVGSRPGKAAERFKLVRH